MMKQFLMSVAVLGAATALVAPAVSADTQVANNQGTTTVTYTGDTTTDTNIKDPNPDDNGSTSPDDTNTTDNNGKQVKGLTLTAVPSFDFGSNPLKDATTKAATVAGATDFKNVSKDVATAAQKAVVDSTKGASSIYVSDTRGTTQGYKIFGAASSLYNADGKQLNVGSLELSVANGVDNNGAQITGLQNVNVYHATTLTGQTSDANTNDKNQVTNDVLGGGTQANDLYGKVAGYGNLIAQAKQANGDNATGAVTASLKLASANALANQAYNGVITYTLQDADLAATPAAK
ncbi:WxL domain-containing protein [Weissella cibaria]|uniref:WxL domain-containing protein n=1 Tax=Weissella cibaria TaxID=137591 RepID=UPI000FFE2E8B|nr:WxL domain-containing protein [Weissella cibaria]MBZ6068769.1 WxL domain-containing protein [Weissella cibaria]QAT24628.1 hypothetical protein EQZ96_00745 [Weissella cibaria]HJF37289.1 WxL domain-containing protein [Weissella cibaria]